MLVLTRRVGEQILIDNGKIEIKILYIRRGNVAVGIRAPSHVDVDRKEIYLRKMADLQAEAKEEAVTEII